MVDPPGLLLSPPWVFVWPVVLLLLGCVCVKCCYRLRRSHRRVLLRAQAISSVLVRTNCDSEDLELEQVRAGVDGRLR